MAPKSVIKQCIITFPYYENSGFYRKVSTCSSVKSFPRVLITNAKASKLELPGKRGFPLSSSGIMHPRAHISMDLSYVLEPTNSSGALYHLVDTYSVKLGSFSIIVLH